MIDVPIALLLFSIIVFLGVFGEVIFSKTNIPDVLLLFILGLLIGPVLGIVSFGVLRQIAPYFSVIALIVILVEGGLNLNIYNFIKETPFAFLLSVFGFVFSMIGTVLLTSILSLLGFLSGWTIFHGLLLGSIIGGSSSLIVIPLLSKSNARKEIKDLLSVESAFTDALCVVVAIALIRFLMLPQQGLQSIFQDIFASFSIGIVIGIVAGIIWLYVLTYFKRKVAASTHYYMLTFAFLLLLYVFVEYLKGSPALAVLAFGLVLGNAVHLKNMLKLENEIRSDAKVLEFSSEAAFFVKTFFFTFMGMLFVFELKSVFIGLLLAAFIFAARFTAVKLIAFSGRFSLNEQNLMITMLPRGLAAAVLAMMPFQLGIPGTENFAAYVFTVIFATIIITTVFYFFVSKYNAVKTVV